MKYKIIGMEGNIPFETSAKELDEYITQHCYTGEIQWLEYLLDESGKVCGLKGLADLGHGYGFDNGREEFTIRVGETYTFTHDFTSVDGPSDWSDDSFKVTIQLVEEE